MDLHSFNSDSDPAPVARHKEPDSWERYPSAPAVQEPGASAQEVGTNHEKVGTTAQEVGTNDKKVGTKTSEVGTKKPPSGDNSSVFNDYDVLTA